MDNLLPTVAVADVTSNQFRENSLPYQQWEAHKTHCTPKTPLDLGHLLPPIAGRPERHDVCSPPPTLLRIEPQWSCPAPFNPNPCGRYHPTLDPSPIGMEERGAVQPVRITRIIPNQESGNRGARRAQQSDDAKTSRSSTCVIIINGYNLRASQGSEWCAGGIEEDTDVDVCLQSCSRFFEHATLFPSQWIRRTLQNGSMRVNIPNKIPGCTSGTKEEVSFGLIVVLAGTDDWSVCGGLHDPQAWRGHLGSDESGKTLKLNSCLDENNLLEASVEKVTRCIFQAEDGTPGPSWNAFRLQFEPGPLGMELYEDPDRRGIVQVSRILQAGQAEQDGRLSVGSLIVAVGDWGECNSATTGLNAGALDNRVSSEERSVLVRSLADLEGAILSRDSDQLFHLWAIDREAPEVVSLLGAPNPTEGSRRLTPGWYSPPHFLGLEASADTGYPRTMEVGLAASCSTCSLSDCGASGIRGFGAGDGSDKLAGTDEEVLGWQSRRSEGIHEERCNRAARSDPNLPPACGSPFDRGRDIKSNGSMSRESRVIDENHSAQRRESDDQRGAWEFETGGGIFNEDDESLAARRGPSSYVRKQVQVQRPVFPLGLQASATDKFPVFICFCNNHTSAAMQVSWIDYDGKRIPRRSLAPGAFYFERSFATHPWVVQDLSIADEGNLGDGTPGVAAHEQTSPLSVEDKGNCCVFRLGNVMAAAPLTGSIIWDPTRKTISVAKQTKVRVASMSQGDASPPVNVAPIEGVGLHPAKRRFDVANSEREVAKAARVALRAEKTKILEEMRSWRMYPRDGVEQNATKCSTRSGLEVDAPNLRFIMIGSQRL